MKPVIIIASDHAGFDLKETLKSDIAAFGFEVSDLGPMDTNSVDYPDYANKLATAIKGDGLGVLICGSGIGMSIAANRHRHIRAALCHNATEATLTRKHNNANVLCLGARIIGSEVARDALKAFLTTAFEGGRHETRVAKLS
jgi:ribose 5-phosphate isomerase B